MNRAPETRAASVGSTLSKAVCLFLFAGCTPAHATPPDLFSSKTETIQNVPMTRGHPYTFWSVYVVAVPRLKPADVIQCHGQAEVSDLRRYNVKIARAIAKSPTGGYYRNLAPITVNPLYGENVTPDMHHMAIDSWGTDRGESGIVYYSLILEAASSHAIPGDYARLEHGHGGIWCTVFR